jgi:large subunit ribosomal protein L22
MRHTYMPVMVPKAAAKAIGKDLPISPKVSIEICNFVRGKELEIAIAILKRVQEKTQAVPYKRFSNGAGHKPGKGMAAGRYPVKASKYFLALLENAKANASNQGLTGTLKITHIAAQRANEPFRARAKERVTFKRTHVEVIVTESAPAEKRGNGNVSSSRNSGNSSEKAKKAKTEKAEPAKVEA